jgi:hypothetical protein
VQHVKFTITKKLNVVDMKISVHVKKGNVIFFFSSEKLAANLAAYTNKVTVASIIYLSSLD